jgi:hypothetical protein
MAFVAGAITGGKSEGSCAGSKSSITGIDMDAELTAGKASANGSARAEAPPPAGDGMTTRAPQLGQMPRFPARWSFTLRLCPLGQLNRIPMNLRRRSGIKTPAGLPSTSDDFGRRIVAIQRFPIIARIALPRKRGSRRRPAAPAKPPSFAAPAKYVENSAYSAATAWKLPIPRANHGTLFQLLLK